MEFGATIRAARLASGVTATATADAIGISVPYLVDIERGNRRPFPDSETITKLARVINVDPDVLIEMALLERIELPPGYVVMRQDRADRLIAAGSKLRRFARSIVSYGGSVPAAEALTDADLASPLPGGGDGDETT